MLQLPLEQRDASPSGSEVPTARERERGREKGRKDPHGLGFLHVCLVTGVARAVKHPTVGEDAAAGMSESSVEGDAVKVDADESQKHNDDASKVEMAQESVRSSAAEIPVTSNGETDNFGEDHLSLDLNRHVPGGLNLSETHITSSNYGATTEGIIEAEPYKGSSSQPSSPVVSPSSVAASRLAGAGNDFFGPRGMVKLDSQSGAVVVADELKNPAIEKLELVRKWSINTYKEEFGYNAETQKLLSKNGETLLGAINFFIASVKTLVDKTIEDTMVNIKQYEAARVEYDAYRTDLEELNLGPRDATTLPKIEQSQQIFQIHREKYEKMRNDVSIKLKFLEENKVKVLHNQLILFHNAIAAYFAGNQQQLEQTLKQFHIKLKTPGADAPSWLEEQ
uniref:ADP-ribosylation factor interacting protein 1 (arfaptin 1) n=1 Tax=Erpetoichthys calabaricus TaxID=27687 RepID=A0A8C4RY54_ERPCA